MRVIAGQYRGRVLKSPHSMQVRPTSDRLREALFGVLTPRIEGARFLDLCAGSGAVGIEAISRGASFVTFVDHSRKMCGLIESNLDLCLVPEKQTEVVLSDAAEYLRRTVARDAEGRRGGQAWDIIFFDPPYANDYTPVLSALGENPGSLLGESGVIVVEHHHKNTLREEVGGVRRWRVLRQGESILSFYEAA